MQPKEQAIQEAMRLAKSSEGQKLVDTIRKENPGQLQNILESASKGDLNQAQQSIAALLNNPQIRKLLEQLGR